MKPCSFDEVSVYNVVKYLPKFLNGEFASLGKVALGNAYRLLEVLFADVAVDVHDLNESPGGSGMKNHQPLFQPFGGLESLQ